MSRTLASIYEEAQSSPTSIMEGMDDFLSYERPEKYYFDNSFDCDEDDVSSLKEYWSNH